MMMTATLMFQATTEVMRFLYLYRLFLFCVLSYFVNRWVFKAYWTSGFVHEHLNDLICIPFWVPIMLWSTTAWPVRRTARRSPVRFWSR